MRSWFRVADKCENCGLDFKGEEGAFLGAITLNYGFVVFGLFPLIFFLWKLSGQSLQILGFAIGGTSILAPFLLYPLSWCAWVWIQHHWLRNPD